MQETIVKIIHSGVNCDGNCVGIYKYHDGISAICKFGLAEKRKVREGRLPGWCKYGKECIPGKYKLVLMGEE